MAILSCVIDIALESCVRAIWERVFTQPRPICDIGTLIVIFGN